MVELIRAIQQSYQTLFIFAKYFMLSFNEIEIVLDDLLTLHGYDFTYYSKESLLRRINKIYRLEAFKSFVDFRNKIKYDSNYIDHLINRMTVNVTEMFRDPEFYLSLRNEVLPHLAQQSHIKIWHAGCSTGEEVYSMAIILHECGLLEKTTLYATDINLKVLEKASAGTYSLSLLSLYETKYKLSGGTNNFTDYYEVTSSGGKLIPSLGKQMVYSHHNLAMDAYFNKFDIILCRNVLIYFDKPLQTKVLNLFDMCLNPSSFLALGEKETIRFTSIENKYASIGAGKIWKKLR